MDAGSGAREIERLRNGYLEVVKRALTHTLYRPMDVRFNDGGYVADEKLRESVVAELSKKDFDWVTVRAEGRDWPRFAQTMVGLQRLENVEQCVKQVIADEIPGDLIETGVWRGGVAIFMRAILEAYGERDRIVYAADSFEGLPPPDATAFPADAGANCTPPACSPSRATKSRATSISTVCSTIRCGSSKVGSATHSPPFATERGRWCGSTATCTSRRWTRSRNLYPGLAVGGYLIVDDYEYEPCKKAVEEYRAANGITDPVTPIDWLGAFWRRTT